MRHSLKRTSEQRCKTPKDLMVLLPKIYSDVKLKKLVSYLVKNGDTIDTVSEFE